MRDVDQGSRIPRRRHRKKEKKNVSKREKKKGNMYIQTNGANLFVFISSIVSRGTNAPDRGAIENACLSSLLDKQSILDQKTVLEQPR
jgi:hypothetical protein